MYIIGEKINGSIPKTSKAIDDHDEAYIRYLAKAQTAAGSDFLDCCASRNEGEIDIQKWLIGMIQEESDLPICVDSPSPDTCVKAAFEFCNKPGIINSVSMEGDKCNIVLPKIQGTDWGVVALLCDNNGIPEDAEGRLEVFARLMEEMKKYEIAPNRIYIDPLVETLGANEESLLMFADVTREVKKQYPSIHITSGLSNISFGLPYRRMINMAFLVLAMEAGMDSAIIDPLIPEFQGIMYAANALIDNDEMGIEYIGAFRDGVFGRPLKADEKKLVATAAEAGVAEDDKEKLEELLHLLQLK